MSSIVSREAAIVKQRPKVFRILSEIPGDASDQALVDGLVHVEPDEQIDLITLLFNRNNESGLVGLPALFHLLTPDAQSLIVQNTMKLFGALRRCVRSSSSRTRENTLAIVRRSGNPRLAYLAGHAIHDGSPNIRCEAATTLFTLADNHYRAYRKIIVALRDGLENDPGLFNMVFKSLKQMCEDREFLITPLREALSHYESHHRPEILEASMLMAPYFEKELFQSSAIKRGKLTHAMLELLSSSLSPRFVPFIYVALCYPELRRRIIPMIAACRDPDFFAAFIKYQWLGRDPAIKKNLYAIRNIDWLNDGFEAAFSLPASAATLAPPWLLSLGLPNDQKVSLLMNFLIIDNPNANRAAAWALVDINTSGSTVALGGLLDHDNPSISTIAKLELIRRARSGQDPNTQSMRRGRPEEWANMLGRAGLSENFEDFWKNFENIHPNQARATGNLVFKYIPGFETQVQIKLVSKHTADRLRALRLIMSLFVCKHFEKELFAIANDKSHDIRSAAMRVLGMIGGETSRRILERGLGDEHPSVEAAAIDALEIMQAAGRDKLVTDKIKSDNADVRAAAVRCLLKMRVPMGAEVLITMLQDTRPDHRCAALWLVDQLKLTSIAERIESFAGDDPDPRIARIALHVARRLIRSSTGEKNNTYEKVAT